MRPEDLVCYTPLFIQELRLGCQFGLVLVLHIKSRRGRVWDSRPSVSCSNKNLAMLTPALHRNSRHPLFLHCFVTLWSEQDTVQTMSGRAYPITIIIISLHCSEISLFVPVLSSIQQMRHPLAIVSWEALSIRSWRLWPVSSLMLGSIQQRVRPMTE